MALSFFHGGQLAKGLQAYEEEGEGSHAQSLRRLYSETALRERYLDNTGNGNGNGNGNGSRPSLAPSRPRTASGHIGPRASSRPRSSRPETSRTRFQEVLVATDENDPPARPKTSASKPEPSKTRTFWGISKPSFLSLRQAQSTAGPKSSGIKSWKQKQADKREALREKDDAAPAVQPPALKVERPRTATQPPLREQPSRLKETRRVDTPVAAQSAANPSLFLAESLAHVIVGEWLYKDPHKPGILPQSNILQRHVGPPPRGATGVPQRRWFRIDPYERHLSWSSKWDTVETAQHKMSRKVPIKLVFEVPNRLPLDGCIPAQAAPYDYSIVVVAPSKVLKMTAPDESRHNMWLTALQYLVDSTKKVDDRSWPDVLAARLALLTSPVEDLFKELPVPRDEDPRRIVDKPLPPSPPASGVVAAMRPPSVPRYPQHARQTSAGLSATAESEAFAPSEAASVSVRSQRAEAVSIRSQRAEPYTPSEEKNPIEQHRTETGKRADQEDTDMDQMDALLDRLSSPGTM